MHITKATYDKSNKRVGGNNKMKKLIKPFVIALEEGGTKKLIDKIEEHFLYKEDDPQPSTSGQGLSKAGSNAGQSLQSPKILPSDPNALIDRFDLLFSSQKAGHTGVRNEIVSILDELKRQGVLKTNEYKKLNSLIKK